MSLSFANINIDEAAVTAVNEFNSKIGYGVDFYVKARNSRDVEYFQVVVYDDEARSYCRHIHEGDHVRVTGIMTTKPYKKKNGENGLQLIIERPLDFRKYSSGNSEQQLLQKDYQFEAPSLKDIIDAENAVSASAITAGNDTNRNEDSRCVSTEAVTAVQNPHEETAQQHTETQDRQIPQKEKKQYPPLHFIPGLTYRPPTPEEEAELPF